MDFRRFRPPVRCLPLLVLLGCLVPPALAAPVNGKVFTVRQPDGSVLSVRVYGDEFYRRMADFDGYTLVRDPETGWVCYAREAAGGDVESTGIAARAGEKAPAGLTRDARPDPDWLDREVARKRARRGQAAAGRLPSPPPPTTGTRLGLCIIIDFPETPGTFTREQIADFCNQAGYTGNGNNGSVRDFFLDVSDGKLDFSHEVYGYHRAAHPRSYYDGPDKESYGAAMLIAEALEALKGQIDFTRFDLNSDGVIDAISAFYAGDAPPENNYALWPHMANFTQTVPLQSFSAQGKSAGDYQMTNIGSSLVIGTFCHECGHMVCKYVDYYDTRQNPTGNGLDTWCLMSAGNQAAEEKNPTPPQPYLRWKSGWLTPTAPVNGANTLPCSLKNALLLTKPGSGGKEHYLLAGFRNTGRMGGYAGSGLAVFHIDENKDGNVEPERTQEKHYEAALVQADGRNDLETAEGRANAEDLFYSGNNTALNASTTPHSNWWDGSASGVVLSAIGAAGGESVTFTFGAATGREDVNRDGAVNAADLALLSAYFAATEAALPFGRESADVNADGKADALDVLQVSRALAP